jgi:hypothetical protein
MTDDLVRERWLELRSRINREYSDAKDSQGSLFALHAQYRRLNPHERRAVDRLSIDELASPDENVRFDALDLIWEFQIREALPGLRELLSRLANDSRPGAPFEAAKVRRLIEYLTRVES